MTKANPRVEIYFRQKGKKRWLKSGRIYKLKHVHKALEDIDKLVIKQKGKYQYTLKEFRK